MYKDMEHIDSQFDSEGINSTLKKINYYSFIPKHIKYSAIGLESAVNNIYANGMLSTNNDIPSMPLESYFVQEKFNF